MAGNGQSISNAIVFGDVNLVRDVAGKVSVGARQVPYRVDSFPTDVPELTVEQARAQPARLLQQRFEQGRYRRFSRLTWLPPAPQSPS